MSQPNLDITAPERTWTFRFLMIIALTGVAVGLVGGALMRLLHAVEHVAWHFHAGSLLEGIRAASATRRILILGAAGLIVAFGGRWLRKTLGSARDVNSAIWFHHGNVPLLPTLGWAIHSIVIVGMGASLGRESAIKQAGGALASQLARWSGLSNPEQRVLVACGVGAGMAAAYNVPVGGALFAAEVLLGSISLHVMFPVLLCAGVAIAASWTLLPTGPIYLVPEYPLSVSLFIWSLWAGPLLGLMTVPLVRAIGWSGKHKPRRGSAIWIVPAVTFVLLGTVSVLFPELLGNGQDVVQLAFADELSVTLLLLLPALKLLATTSCLASGASGGLFTPTMTIGALLGGLFGHAWHQIYPGASLGCCAVIGACAFLAAASQAPVSALVLVLELTRHVDATMVPMLLAVAGAVLVSRRIEPKSIYSIRVDSAIELSQERNGAPETRMRNSEGNGR